MKKRLAKKIFYGKSLLSYNLTYSIRAGSKLFPNRLFSIPAREPRNKAVRKVLRKFRKTVVPNMINTLHGL
jgi:hypothetical protein